MRKFLLSLAAAALCLPAMATTVTFDLKSTKGLEGVPTATTAEEATWTLNDMQFKSSKAYNTGSYAYIMIGQGGYIQLPEIDEPVTSISFTFNSGSVSTAATMGLYEGSASGTQIGETIAQASNGVANFSISNGVANTAYYLVNNSTSAKNVQLVSISITYGEDSTDPDPGTDPDPVDPTPGGDTTNSADFNTFNNGKANTAYSTYTTAAGWTATNSAIVKIGDDLAPTLNGKTTAVGTLTSPTLTGGIGTLTFSYENTFAENNGVSVQIDIKQNGEVVATETLTNTDVTQSTEYTFNSEDFNVAGDFVIEIKNLSPSNNTGNKDRVSIWNLSWTSFDEGTPSLKPAGIEFSATTATATMGEEFTAPTLTNPNNLTATYSSSDEAVATVNSSTGAVTLVAAGTTTITATTPADETYKAGTASYTLTVKAASTGEEPGGDDNDEGNVTQPFTKGLGFPESSSAKPTTATEYTATDTDITYTLMNCYANSGYLMVNGKDTENAYISWSLDMDMAQLKMTTSSSCSTNEASTVNVYANDNLIGNYKVNVQSASVLVDIPETYQAAGTVYKVESGTDKYNQQFASFTYIKVGNEQETPEPEVPEAPEGTITVAKALELIKAGYNGTATVSGIISSIDEISTSFGNATYYIKDDINDSEALEVYRGKWLDGANFTEEDQIEVGGEIIVEGTIMNYNGTPEFTTGSKVVSYKAPEGGGETPEPVEPTGQSVTFDFTDPTTLISGFDVTEENGAEYDLTGQSFTEGDITISFEAEEGVNTLPRLYYGSSWTMRFYNKTSFTLSSSQNYVIESVEFKATNLNNSSIEWSTGSFANNKWTPAVGDDVTSLTVSKTATGNNPTVSTITVYYDFKTGVDSVVAEDGEAVYYNLQGVRVNNPERGIYIKVVGNKATKVVM